MTCLPILALAALLAPAHTATAGCKNCVALGKEQRAMFRLHSDACLASSGADPRRVAALLAGQLAGQQAGQLADEPALRRHVYCVLLKCKLIAKDGKLQKAAVLGKMPNRPDAKNATKVLESCADQTGDSPEDIAWNIFRCGYDKKASLFNYMPLPAAGDMDNN